MTDQKVFPADGKIIFLAADDIRQEIGNKLSVIGLFNDGFVFIDPTAAAALTANPAQAIGIPLAIFFAINDGVGQFSARLEIFTPSGKSALSGAAVNQVQKNPNETANFLVKFPLFAVREFGDYAVKLMLDDHQYDRVVHIQVASAALMAKARPN